MGPRLRGDDGQGAGTTSKARRRPSVYFALNPSAFIALVKVVALSS